MSSDSSAFRKYRTRPHQALRLTRYLRDRIIGACPDTLVGVREKAMLAVRNDTLYRRGELVTLKVEDIIPSDNGSAQILIRRSTADPLGQGRSGYISPHTFQVLNDWRDAAEINSGYIFRRLTIGKVGKSPLHAFSVSRIIKIAAEK